MSLAVTYSRALIGVQAPLVHVEVHLASGLPAFSIVGLPEQAVKESRDRVRAAITNSQFEFPIRKITVNLAPADLPKVGSHYDLAIALGILVASKQIPNSVVEQHEYIGELALSGELRSIQGALPIAIQTANAKRALILPKQNASEASLVQSGCHYGASHLLEVCAHLSQQQNLSSEQAITPTQNGQHKLDDLADVKGQAQAKRVLEIAAAGQHNLLMIGPPGTGKTMLASRLPSILPPMSDEEAMASASIHSISSEGFDPEQWGKRPFRNPHHTASGVALVGGGSTPRPGEISLAHNGVLFLDELTEYERRVLDVLREPMEKGKITISRAARQAEFPSRFQLVAAMNPCPCGYLGDPTRHCRCTEEQIRRYQMKISGPLLDRIDLHVKVPRLPHKNLTDKQTECSNTVRARILSCRKTQLDRAGCPNALLNNKHIEAFCKTSSEGEAILKQAMDKLGLSARAYHRILKVARTIADLADSTTINAQHISEAISYRVLDRHQSS